MATTYDTELARINRQRALADALRATGNESIPASIHTGGRIDAPVSKFEYANRALSQLLGAYQAASADRAQKKLNAEDQQNIQDFVNAKRASEMPDENSQLDPSISSDAGPTPVAASQIPLTRAERQRKYQAAVLRGLQYGGSTGPLAQEQTTRDLFPPVQQPYTLNEGDVRYNGQNQLIGVGAAKQYKEPVEDRELKNIVDPTAKSGYRTILRKNWKGEQLWEKPTAGSTMGDLTSTQQSEAEKLAKQVFNYNIPPLPTGNRNPVNTAAMAMVADMSDKAGEPYKAYEYQSRSRALGAFAAGPEGRSVRAFNTMLDHVAEMKDAADKLNNGELPDFNKMGNWFVRKTGGGAPAALETIKNAISGEIVKAVTGGPGAAEDRDKALAEVNAATSPQAVLAVADSIQHLGRDQLANLRRQFMSTTGLTETHFANRLSPRAAELLSSYDETPTQTDAGGAMNAAPLKNAKGWVLHVDKNGNKAYVGPNNEIEEVK